MARTRRQPLSLYAAVSDDFGIQFYFHAANAEAATQALDRWNRYHSFRRVPGGGWHTAQPAEGEVGPDWIHDEWIPRT